MTGTMIKNLYEKEQSEPLDNQDLNLCDEMNSTFMEISTAERLFYSLLNIFWFGIFFTTLLSPFHTGLKLFETHGSIFLISRYCILILSGLFIVITTLKLQRGDFRKIKEFSYFIKRKKFTESSISVFLTALWTCLILFISYHLYEDKLWFFVLFGTLLIVPSLSNLLIFINNLNDVVKESKLRKNKSF